MTQRPCSDARSGISANDWDDWKWHIRNAIRSVDALEHWITLSSKERQAIERTEQLYRWQVTPYYASLMDSKNPECPVRRQAIPSLEELSTGKPTSIDPVDELLYRKTNRIVHKYPDRVILNLTRVCPVYCRHCTRKYHTTHRSGTYLSGRESDSWSEDVRYIAENEMIRDVLITGGDPLSYPDAQIEKILADIRAVPHVEVIRIGTRFPVLLPQRITSNLCAILKRFHPIWLSTHFNHPRELTPAAEDACDRLLSHGVPLQNQTVLLKGVNDDRETMRVLVQGLVRMRVRPYYLYHCDRATGVSHFETSVEVGRDIMRSLWGWTSGFAVPRYILTTPVGKVSLERPENKDVDDGLRLTGWSGDSFFFEL